MAECLDCAFSRVFEKVQRGFVFSCHCMDVLPQNSMKRRECKFKFHLKKRGHDDSNSFEKARECFYQF